jgi:hypothetical protein
MVWWFVFFEFFDPFYFEGCNFLNFISFLMIFSAPNVPIREVQVLFGHHKQGNPPLGSGLPEALKCLVTGWFTLYESGFCFPFFSHWKPPKSLFRIFNFPFWRYNNPQLRKRLLITG